MSRGPFTRKRGGVVVRLGADERSLLARLLDDVCGMLAQTDPDPSAGAELDEWALLEAAFAVEAPGDPAVARLLPDASADDPELAASFRRLTEHGLRQSKREALMVGAAALRRPDPVQLSASEATSLLKAMNDVRLVVAARLDLRTDQDATALHERLQRDAQRVATDPEPSAAEQSDLGLMALYEALTWWQESLVGALN